MADPVTDSRLPGFNPEVEESKAAAEKAAAESAAAARGEVAEAIKEPDRPHRCVMCGGTFTEKTPRCPSCGAEYEMQS